jgi:hypothetical protein
MLLLLLLLLRSVQVGLLNADGNDIPLALANATAATPSSPLLMAPGTTAVLNSTRYKSNTTTSSSVVLLISQPSQTFRFQLGAAGQPAALSLLRDFSAPVNIDGDAYDDSSSMQFVAQYDSNPFARWVGGSIMPHMHFKCSESLCVLPATVGCGRVCCASRASTCGSPNTVSAPCSILGSTTAWLLACG